MSCFFIVLIANLFPGLFFSHPIFTLPKAPTELVVGGVTFSKGVAKYAVFRLDVVKNQSF